MKNENYVDLHIKEKTLNKIVAALNGISQKKDLDITFRTASADESIRYLYSINNGTLGTEKETDINLTALL